MNETPVFMKFCIYAVRANKSLAWAVYKTADELYGSPVTDEELKRICDRPKTPKFKEYRCYKSADRWLARFFNMAFLAFADEMSDEDILRVWRLISRSDTGQMERRGSKKESRKFMSENYIIRWRERDKNNDWGTVK